jgi:hypothetical protein
MSTTPDQPIESIEIPDDVSELTDGGHEALPYRSLLEIWRAVIQPAVSGEMRKDPISPQWATKMVTTYPGISFADVDGIHHGVFDLAAELGALLDEEIASDDECLKVVSAEEDVERNSGHYRNMLIAWQVHLMLIELNWKPSDKRAAVQLAVLSEVQQMFLGQTGLVAHLDTIGFQYTDEDQAELADHLMAKRAEALGQEGGSE